MAKVESAGENFDLVLAQQIIYGAGFFGILYSAYIMVLDRYVRLATPGFCITDRSTFNVQQGNHQENRGRLTAITAHREPTPYTTRPDRRRFAQHHRCGPSEHRQDAEDH